MVSENLFQEKKKRLVVLNPLNAVCSQKSYFGAITPPPPHHYSLDLVSRDFWLFSELKSALKEIHFELVEVVKTKYRY